MDYEPDRFTQGVHAWKNSWYVPVWTLELAELTLRERGGLSDHSPEPWDVGEVLVDHIPFEKKF